MNQIYFKSKYSFFEFSEGCNENTVNVLKTGDDSNSGDIQVKFKINYCTSEDVKIVGDFG